ncbi:uncharacterized protein BP5553_06977 [Venustampulla echinocandica]|uniref:Protein SMG7 n=1 Tax=Venustampulla echinocandica TaxID=2656787 RepID=A0A370TI64_9HELO|nr:uncharacterized protein BP5553_06977 [Venustampulla echinocandica]RDL35046.1 hypothetical protein BP5553_06977 [Venustampulla echinocandica]
MATTAAQNWTSALEIEKDLQLLLKGKTARFDDVDHLINQLRITCEAAIFLDFEYAHRAGVEGRLWDAHININQRYRKVVDHFRQKEQKKHIVERRKVEKRYVDFIKTSQFFYRGYIQRLASHFAGMRKLRQIAHRLHLDPLSVDERVTVSPEVEHLIDMSCHATLLRLGDLSRYRNTLRTKDRSWEPALGFYELADALVPTDGSAHNQMAVIALADGDHLDAVYQLYRALAVDEPHKLAKGNLELEFKKITSAWEKKRPQPKTDSLSTLVWWFVLLQAKFYEGVDFSTHEELENEVISRLARLLKEQSFDATHEKLVLTKSKEGPSEADIRSFYFCLAFNIRMLSMLLQVLKPELEDTAAAGSLPQHEPLPNQSQGNITAVTRRVLPALRQYSVWLVSQVDFIVANLKIGPLSMHSREMWKIYADVLTRLANLFPAESLPSINYLLEEDESTVGFKPLRDPQLPHACNVYAANDSGSLKPSMTDTGIKRQSPDVEMLARVRDILLCGLVLQGDPKYPIVLRDRAFVYTDQALPASGIASPVSAKGPVSSLESPMKASSTIIDTTMAHESVKSSRPETPELRNSIDTDMHRMVDNLVESYGSKLDGSDETSYGMHSLTANEVFAPVGSSGLRSPHQVTPKMLPSLPGIWNSAFTPQPNELQPTSPNRPGTRRQLSPFPLSTRQQQVAAAASLDQMTGYSGSSRNSWGENSPRPTSNPTSQAVNQLLQESLTQQFRPLSMSSQFSDSSNIFGNTTPAHQRIKSGQRGVAPTANGNNSTLYPGGTDFDTRFMLQSSLLGKYNDNQTQPRWGYRSSPPGGQGG